MDVCYENNQYEQEVPVDTNTGGRKIMEIDPNKLNSVRTGPNNTVKHAV